MPALTTSAMSDLDNVAWAAWKRNASAMPSSTAARPPLKRKNFTPASLSTNRSVNAIPTPRCARKKKRTVERDMRVGGWGRWDGLGRWVGWVSPTSPTCLTCPTRPKRSAEPLIDLGPVDDVPPGIEVVGTAVLLLQVVGVFPDVDAEHDFLPFHQRAVLVRRALNRELAALIDDPGPAAAEAADAGLLQLFLELVEAAERSGDRVRDFSGRRAARVRAHHLPEHRVVGVAAAVVAHRGADVFGHGVDALQQILDALRLQLGMLVERGVQIRHVGLVVLAVMNLHRRLVDVGFERVGRVRKRRKCVSHQTVLL